MILCPPPGESLHPVQSLYRDLLSIRWAEYWYILYWLLLNPFFQHFLSFEDLPVIEVIACDPVDMICDAVNTYNRPRPWTRDKACPLSRFITVHHHHHRGHTMFHDDMIMYSNINDQQPVIAMITRSSPWSNLWILWTNGNSCIYERFFGNFIHTCMNSHWFIKFINLIMETI